MPSGLAQAPIPVQEPMVYPPNPKAPNQSYLITYPWINYLTSVVTTVNANPLRVNAVSLAGQTASIGSTDFSGGGLNAGLYRISHYARITQAAGTSSSLTVQLDWNDGGVVQTETFAAITGNTTATHQCGQPLLINVVEAAPIRYATTYASVGAPAMAYSLFVLLELIQA